MSSERTIVYDKLTLRISSATTNLLNINSSVCLRCIELYSDLSHKIIALYRWIIKQKLYIYICRFLLGWFWRMINISQAVLELCTWIWLWMHDSMIWVYGHALTDAEIIKYFKNYCFCKWENSREWIHYIYEQCFFIFFLFLQDCIHRNIRKVTLENSIILYWQLLMSLYKSYCEFVWAINANV